MNLNIEISFEQLLAYIKKLPLKEQMKIFSEIKKELNPKEQASQPNDLQKLLLKGPVWGTKEYEDFLSTKDQLNKFGEG